MCEIFGYSEAELSNLTAKKLSHPEDRDLADAPRARLLAGEIESARLEKRYFRKDGRLIWVNIAIAMARNAGNITDFFNIPTNRVIELGTRIEI